MPRLQFPVAVLGSEIFLARDELDGRSHQGETHPGVSIPGPAAYNEDEVVSRLRRRLAAVIPAMLLHGLNFIFVGVIGEYLSRIFDDSKGRPRVIIAESIHADDSLHWL